MKPTNILVAILGGAFGIAHLGMIGMIWNSKKLPVINPPVGDYSAYEASVSQDGYSIKYRSNDPKVMGVNKYVDKTNGFFGIGGKSNVTYEEQYTMDGARHLGANSEGKLTAANVACIEAVGGGKQTGRVVGASMGAAAAGYVTGIPFVGPVLGGLVALFGADKGADVGGEIATELSEDCEDGDTKDSNTP
tara:strand:- start:1096 stop:1668 length:573 start_codon:yes stop_codon:yes gene_type:complete